VPRGLIRARTWVTIWKFRHSESTTWLLNPTTLDPLGDPKSSTRRERGEHTASAYAEPPDSNTLIPRRWGLNKVDLGTRMSLIAEC